MIPIHTFSQNARWSLVFLEDNGFVSISSIHEYTLPRGLHRLDVLHQQRKAVAQNYGATAKVDRQIAALDLALSEIHQLVNPSIVGSVHGGPQVATSGTDDLGLSRCRFRDCPEMVDRSDRFFHGSVCRSCRSKLPDPEPSTDERIDHE